jgi:hypothetical protein
MRGKVKKKEQDEEWRAGLRGQVKKIELGGGGRLA